MAYHHTYGMNVTLTQCSNNFGPRQHPEKLIPTVIRTALAGKPIPVYGQGTNVRDWLSVEDHCHALDLVFHRAAPGSRYNVGGHHEIKIIDLVRMICHELDEQIGKGPGGKYQELIQFVTDRPGHDFRYAIDHSKITAELGWKPSTEFSAALRATVQYFVKEFS
jgi:dTDP-glucose 4,6-dehydratase